MSNRIEVIHERGRERLFRAQWELAKPVPWLELRVLWYVTQTDAAMPRRWSGVTMDYIFGSGTVAIHRIAEPALVGKAELVVAIPAHPAGGALGSGCVHWAVELIAAPKAVLVREHFANPLVVQA